MYPLIIFVFIIAITVYGIDCYSKLYQRLGGIHRPEMGLLLLWLFFFQQLSHPFVSPGNPVAAAFFRIIEHGISDFQVRVIGLFH